MDMGNCHNQVRRWMYNQQKNEKKKKDCAIYQEKAESAILVLTHTHLWEKLLFV